MLVLVDIPLAKTKLRDAALENGCCGRLAWIFIIMLPAEIIPPLPFDAVWAVFGIAEVEKRGGWIDKMDAAATRNTPTCLDSWDSVAGVQLAHRGRKNTKGSFAFIIFSYYDFTDHLVIITSYGWRYNFISTITYCSIQRSSNFNSWGGVAVSVGKEDEIDYRVYAAPAMGFVVCVLETTSAFLK